MPEQCIVATDSTVSGQGQRVVVKLAIYPFRCYGYLTGQVETISSDAIADEKKLDLLLTKVDDSMKVR